MQQNSQTAFEAERGNKHPNFEIQKIERAGYCNDGVCLRFISHHPQRLCLKDIRFYPNGVRDVAPHFTEIYPIHLFSETIKVTIPFPEHTKDYKTLCFLIKQDCVPGWKVSVNLKSGEIHIEETDFQVL